MWRPHPRSLLPDWGWIKDYDRKWLRPDIQAGLTNAAFGIPQAIAFAAIAGLPPQYGLYMSLLPVIVAIIWGSSWHMVCGPTSAMSAVVFATLSKIYPVGSVDYFMAVTQLTFLVAIFQLAFRMLRLGHFVSVVSHEVVVGFTIGAAILIMKSQIETLMGPVAWVEMLHPSGVDSLLMVVDELTQGPRAAALALCLVTIVLALVIVKKIRWAPHYLMALLFATAIAAVLKTWWPLETVEPISKVLPPLTLPKMDLNAIRVLVPGALAISIVGLLEAVSISRAIALRTGQAIDGEREIFAQGLSNLVAAFFSGYVTSGSFTRSALNVEAGAKSPLATIIGAVVMIIALLLCAPVVALFPQAAMSGVVLLVAWKLIDWKQIRHILESGKGGGLVLAVTVLGGTFVSLEFGVYSGVIASLLLYIRGTMTSWLVPLAPNPEFPARTFFPVKNGHPSECPQLLVTRLQGSLYFGSTDNLRRNFRSLEQQRPGQKFLFIRLEPSSGIDVDGANLLAEENARRQRRGGALYLSCNFEPVRNDMKRIGLPKLIGVGHIFRRKEQFIHHIVPHLDPMVCASCRLRVFRECASQPAPADLATEAAPSAE